MLPSVYMNNCLSFTWPVKNNFMLSINSFKTPSNNNLFAIDKKNTYISVEGHEKCLIKIREVTPDMNSVLQNTFGWLDLFSCYNTSIFYFHMTLRCRNFRMIIVFFLLQIYGLETNKILCSHVLGIDFIANCLYWRFCKFKRK